MTWNYDSETDNWLLHPEHSRRILACVWKGRAWVRGEMIGDFGSLEEAKAAVMEALK